MLFFVCVSGVSVSGGRGVFGVFTERLCRTGVVCSLQHLWGNGTAVWRHRGSWMQHMVTLLLSSVISYSLLLPPVAVWRFCGFSNMCKIFGSRSDRLSPSPHPDSSPCFLPPVVANMGGGIVPWSTVLLMEACHPGDHGALVLCPVEDWVWKLDLEDAPDLPQLTEAEIARDHDRKPLTVRHLTAQVQIVV